MVRSIDSTHYLLKAQLLREKVESFDQFPFLLPALHEFEELTFHPKVTFFIGENGSGKSTLLEALAIAMGFNPEGGSKNFNFATWESHSNLHKVLRLSKGIYRPKDGFFLRAESFFNVASEIERLDAEPSPGPPVIDSYGGRSLHKQSHGESFFALLMKRFRGKGLYFLDEPEAALSPTRQLGMIARMHDLIQDQSQFIIATHSPIILAYPDADIFMFSQDGIRKIEYRETEHYRVTKDFLNNPEKALEILFED